MHRNQVAGLLAAGLAVVCLVALLTPWWTASISGSVGASQSAKPFDGGSNMVDGGKAVLAGILVLLAFLGSFVAAGMLLLAKGSPRVSLLAVTVPGVLLLVAALLAWTTWPTNGISFWDSQSQSANGFNLNMSTYAAFGWYVAIVGFLLAGYTAFRTLSIDASSMVPLMVTAPAATGAGAGGAGAPTPLVTTATAPGSTATVRETQCSATTKAGSRCARTATVGGLCPTHAA